MTASYTVTVTVEPATEAGREKAQEEACRAVYRELIKYIETSKRKEKDGD